MAKVSGTDIYVKVNTGTEGSPVWTKVGGQKDASLSRGAGTVDETDKDSGGWEEKAQGNKNWSVSFDMFLIEDDAGFLEIEGSYDSGNQKQFQLITPTKTYAGKAVVTGLEISGPEGDKSVASFTLEGTGSLTKS